MTDFIPPYPKRHPASLGPLDTLNHLRRDFLSIWPENAFERQFMASKIINRTIFIANCPEVVRYVLVTNHANYEKKSPLIRKVLAPLLGDGAFVSDGALWQKQSALTGPMFSDGQVIGHSDKMWLVIEACGQRWANFVAGDIIPVLPEMRRLSAAISCRILFGAQLDEAQAAQLGQSFTDYQTAAEQLDMNTLFGLPSWIPGIKANKTAKIAKAIHGQIDKLMTEGGGSPDKDTVLARFLTDQKQAGPKYALTHEQIRNELITLFMAAHENVATTLAWAWYLISQCPEVEQRLHDEIEGVLGQRTAVFGDVAQLHYTRAIIKETLRLYPPLPLLSREASAEDTIRKRHVSAGSIMLVSPWLLHRHKLYWDKPDHFIPERFLPDAPVLPDPFAYIPFSVGPRACVAEHFAMAETLLCLALLARRFRLRVPSGQTVTHECRLTLRPKDNLLMQITPR